MPSPTQGPGSAGRPGSNAPDGTGSGPSQKHLLETLQYQRHIGHLTQEVTELRNKLNHRTHQISVLRHVSEILAATPKVAQIGGVLQDVFVQEYQAKTCAIWTLEQGGSFYLPRAAHGVPRSQWSQFQLPSPNPFPNSPLVLIQDQVLDYQMLPLQLAPLRPRPDMQLYFIPFEHQLLLMGFAILGLDPGKKMEEEQETLNILQRQVAVSIYNAWLFRDLGEQRDTLRLQATELERANEALKEADRFKSEFLALTSHELRTPLTGILGFTRLVLDELYEDEEEMRRMLMDSYASGQHLLQLLNDILDLAKIESGRLQMRLESFSLKILLDEIRPIANAYPRKPGVDLIWPDNLTDLPDVEVDPGRLKQVLLNLLSNALKFTREGSVTVTVERGIGQMVLHVVDTGIGVAPEIQPRLFQKFVQAEGGHAREYGGTGLGLVICRHLMDMMGGSIQLRSEGLGKGTALTLTMKIV